MLINFNMHFLAILIVQLIAVNLCWVDRFLILMWVWKHVLKNMSYLLHFPVR